MNPNQTSIRLELGIQAQQIASHIIVNNERISNEINKGIELAIAELSESDNLVKIVKEAAKKEFETIIHKAIFAWDMRAALEKSIRDKMSAELESYSQKLAEKLHSTLNQDGTEK